MFTGHVGFFAETGWAPYVHAEPLLLNPFLEVPHGSRRLLNVPSST